VVCCGLFLDLCDQAIIAGEGGLKVRGQGGTDGAAAPPGATAASTR
jgi:hypothetical protein